MGSNLRKEGQLYCGHAKAGALQSLPSIPTHGKGHNSGDHSGMLGNEVKLDLAVHPLPLLLRFFSRK